MPGEPYVARRHELPAKQPGQHIECYWDVSLRSFAAVISEEGASTRYGTSPRQYMRPEQLFAALRGKWAWNEPDEQMVDYLLRCDRERAPQEPMPPLWADWRRGR